MNAALRRPLLCLCLLLPILTVACARTPAPLPPPPPPAVIARVTAAKKIFLSNAGADAVFASDMVGGANGSYNELYASLKQWGYFQLVDSPAQADLIFEIRSTQQSADVDHTGRGLRPDDYTVTRYPPFFHLSIIDPATQEVLYWIVSGAGYAPSLKQGKINFAISIDKLTDRIKALVVAPMPTQNR